MDIIKGDRKKELENLFSWNQFYKNSHKNEGLFANRWPGKFIFCKYDRKQEEFEWYKPFDDVIQNNRIMADRVQQEITNKFGANK